jgi:hypothetical protein
MSETRFRLAKSDERVGFGAPCASGKGPLRERRRGAADECRSDRETHLQTRSQLRRRACVSRERRTSRPSAPRARAQPPKMGEAPVKYELTGASVATMRTEARDVA